MKISPRYDGPPLIAIDGAAGDQLAPVVRQRRRMEAMLADADRRAMAGADALRGLDRPGRDRAPQRREHVLGGIRARRPRGHADAHPRGLRSRGHARGDGRRGALAHRRRRCTSSSWPATTASSACSPTSTTTAGRRSPRRRRGTSRCASSRATRCGTAGCTSATSRSRSASRRPKSTTKWCRRCGTPPR